MYNVYKQCLFICRMPKKPKYSKEDLAAAIHAVNGRRLTISKAAQEYGVARKTLDDRVKGVCGPDRGPARVLSVEEESSLANYVLFSASMGFPLTRDIMRCYIRTIVNKADSPTHLLNMENGPSNEWFRKFFMRHPNLSEKKPEKQEVEE
jgi:hypothetical protein